MFLFDIFDNLLFVPAARYCSCFIINLTSSVHPIYQNFIYPLAVCKPIANIDRTCRFWPIAMVHMTEGHKHSYEHTRLLPLPRVPANSPCRSPLKMTFYRFKTDPFLF